MVAAQRHTYAVTLPLPLGDAEGVVRHALQQEQFGIISEIDIRSKLREKLGVDHHPHKILGACNPSLAYRALQDNTDVALALPCNVVLEEQQGTTMVTALRPSAVLRRFPGRGVRQSAAEAEERLGRVFAALAASVPPNI